ncbi:hypothetical protein C0J45_20527 [Silurus meridionalis]|nr:hypothetical protein C0J45_20527 [Silurus meridionalis]
MGDDHNFHSTMVVLLLIYFTWNVEEKASVHNGAAVLVGFGLDLLYCGQGGSLRGRGRGRTKSKRKDEDESKEYETEKKEKVDN